MTYPARDTSTEDDEKKRLAGAFFSSEPLFLIKTPFSLWEKGRG
jgi:hypothetical protein